MALEKNTVSPAAFLMVRPFESNTSRLPSTLATTPESDNSKEAMSPSALVMRAENPFAVCKAWLALPSAVVTRAESWLAVWLNSLEAVSISSPRAFTSVWLALVLISRAFCSICVSNFVAYRKARRARWRWRWRSFLLEVVRHVLAVDMGGEVLHLLRQPV